MPRKRGKAPDKFRVGRVSVFFHHSAWWLYHREAGRPVRRRVADDRDTAARVAAEVNARLAAGAASPFAFTPVSVPELRRAFLEHHEKVLGSSMATVRRYAAATAHLERFASSLPKAVKAHEVPAEAFAAYLRTAEVAPNGHPNTATRRLLGKGVLFVLEVCRALYAFAARRRHLPPYAGNQFADLRLGRLKLADAKPLFVFAAETELAFLAALPPAAFPLHFLLAKTGLRVGEATHLLIEDLDLAGGWLRVRNKPGLGWRVKTGGGRRVPLVPELVAVLRRAIGPRAAGPVILRPRFGVDQSPPLVGDLAALERACRERQASFDAADRTEALRVARGVWRDAGATKADAVRTGFLKAARRVGLPPEATCPKAWRHTFATLLQDANVDPLVRQVTLGHRPDSAGGLGMTAAYTHTRPETQRRQVLAAVALWPASLDLARRYAAGAPTGGES